MVVSSVAFAIFFSSCIWILSLTILLPVVIVVVIIKDIHKFAFSLIYSKIIFPLFINYHIPKRKRIFDLLKKHKNIQSKSGPLEILEIGVGPGTNLQFYPENCNLTTLDVNKNFVTHFQQEKKKYEHVNYKKMVIGYAEDMSEIGDSSMDVVVGTYILCSVIDVQKALNEVYRVLKPGGIYVFVEHVGFRDSPLKSAVQHFSAPWWQFYVCNCHITRETITEIKRIGFSEITSEYECFSKTILFLQPHDIGLAIK